MKFLNLFSPSYTSHLLDPDIISANFLDPNFVSSLFSHKMFIYGLYAAMPCILSVQECAAPTFTFEV